MSATVQAGDEFVYHFEIQHKGNAICGGELQKVRNDNINGSVHSIYKCSWCQKEVIDTDVFCLMGYDQFRIRYQ